MKCERCGEVNPAEIHTCSPNYVDKRQWKYNPMTGRSLKKPDDISPSENYCYERGYAHALEVVRQTPQREWQGLTEFEVDQIFRQQQSMSPAGWPLPHGMARAIEAKLKEKNYDS